MTSLFVEQPSYTGSIQCCRFARLYDKEGLGYITTDTLRGLISELLAPLTEEVTGVILYIYIRNTVLSTITVLLDPIGSLYIGDILCLSVCVCVCLSVCAISKISTLNPTTHGEH